MLSYRMIETTRTDAVDMSYQTARRIFEDLLPIFEKSEFIPTIIPYGDRWLVGTQNRKTGLFSSYVVEYEIGSDLR